MPWETALQVLLAAEALVDCAEDEAAECYERLVEAVKRHRESLKKENVAG